MVQAAADGPRHQEGEGRLRHLSLHPAGPVVPRREEDGRLRRVCRCEFYKKDVEKFLV